MSFVNTATLFIKTERERKRERGKEKEREICCGGGEKNMGKNKKKEK